MHKRIIFYVPAMAICRVEFPNPGRPYFGHIETWAQYRRRGCCTSLLSFVLEYLGFAPEMDIRNQSTVMKRVALSVGYERVGVSKRFRYCSDWVREADSVEVVPRHNVCVVARREFWSEKGTTLLLYLKMQANHQVEVGQVDGGEYFSGFISIK